MRRSDLVSIVYRHVPQYRREFYEQLRDRLARDGVELRLVHGDAVGIDASRRDAVALPWSTVIDNRVVRLGAKHLVWQPAWRHVRDSRLVVLEQATKLPLNYLLLAAQAVGGPRVGLWGHGVNLQPDGRLATRGAEAVKRRATLAAHWFFAYTDGVAATVVRQGFPAERVTVVQNALDTRTLRRWASGVTDDDTAQLRRELSIDRSPTGLYLGALYPEKRPGFLLAAAREVRRRVPGFQLLVAGSGPHVGLAEAAAAREPWIHTVGPVFGRRKAVLAAAADVLLMPGLVGLVALDSFALQTPIVTTSVPYHSPEFEYLRDGENGLVLPADATAADYACAVAGLLGSADLRDRLRAGCAASARRYTVEEMVARFGVGIEAALHAPRSGRRAGWRN